MVIETLYLPHIILQVELAALNKYGTIKAAAPVLGISERTLMKHMKDNNIKKNITKEYSIIPKNKPCR